MLGRALLPVGTGATGATPDWPCEVPWVVVLPGWLEFVPATGPPMPVPLLVPVVLVLPVLPLCAIAAPPRPMAAAATRAIMEFRIVVPPGSIERVKRRLWVNCGAGCRVAAPQRNPVAAPLTGA
jgi:hypothetical protein